MIKDIIGEINRFSSEREWDQFHTPKNIASSISIESAELLECFQWQDPAVSEVLDDVKLLKSVEEEIADVLIYSLRMCSILGIEPINAIQKKLKLNHVKYPVNISKGNSKKYDKKGNL